MGVKRQGRETDNSSASNAEVKKAGAILPNPMCLHGIMFNYLNTGTALPLSIYIDIFGEYLPKFANFVVKVLIWYEVCSSDAHKI
jgi:hypothetical protein